MSFCAACSTSFCAWAAVPGAAVAADGAEEAPDGEGQGSGQRDDRSCAATDSCLGHRRRPPSVRAGRRIDRGSCASERTVGRRCRLVVDGARCDGLGAASSVTVCHVEHPPRASRPSRLAGQRRTRDTTGPGSTAGTASRGQVVPVPRRRCRTPWHRDGGQPARGSASSADRLEKSRRIAASSSAVHGSQQSQPPSR